MQAGQFRQRNKIIMSLYLAELRYKKKKSLKSLFMCNNFLIVSVSSKLNPQFLTQALLTSWVCWKSSTLGTGSSVSAGADMHPMSGAGKHCSTLLQLPQGCVCSCRSTSLQLEKTADEYPAVVKSSKTAGNTLACELQQINFFSFLLKCFPGHVAYKGVSNLLSFQHFQNNGTLFSAFSKFSG